MSGENTRKLAAIVAADIAQYSRLMSANEEATIATLRRHRQHVIDPLISEFGGRIANTAGDSLLIEFPSAVDALRFAIRMQADIAAANKTTPVDRQQMFRIGINVGDVVAEGDDLLGDGINVAARLEALAPVGGIMISRTARDQVRDRMAIKFEDCGEVQVKNINRAVRIFRVLKEGEKTPRKNLSHLPLRRQIVYLGGALMILVAAGGLWNWQTVSRSEASTVIAVLAFKDLSVAEGQDYFALGITEDIITDLAKVEGLQVIPLALNQTLKGQGKSDKAQAELLKAAYILEGSVRRAENQIRITAKLLESKSGRQIWAERYDREPEDVFAIQDEIAEHVVAAISEEINGPALERVDREHIPSIEAYDLYAKGRAVRIPPTPENLATALSLFEKTIQLDPEFAGGYSGAAFTYVLLYSETTTFSDRSDGYLDTALLYAQKAVELDPTFGPAWASLADVYLRKREFGKALKAMLKAVDKSPGDTLILARFGRLVGLLGQPERGIEIIESALQINPDSLPLLFFLGANLRANGEYEAAIEALLAHRDRLGGKILPAPSTQLIAAYELAGKQEEAVAEAKALLRTVPSYTLKNADNSHVYEDPAARRAFLDALKRAGIPDGD
ncbi:MAG: adenylate/guanylate cyclase domain-containing protein [Sneathiella sp.]